MSHRCLWLANIILTDRCSSLSSSGFKLRTRRTVNTFLLCLILKPKTTCAVWDHDVYYHHQHLYGGIYRSACPIPSEMNSCDRGQDSSQQVSTSTSPWIPKENRKENNLALSMGSRNKKNVTAPGDSWKKGSSRVLYVKVKKVKLDISAFDKDAFTSNKSSPSC